MARMAKDSHSYYVDTSRGKYRVKRNPEFPKTWQVMWNNSKWEPVTEYGFHTLSDAERWIREWSELVK